MAGLLFLWLLLLSPSVSASEKCSNITNLCANVADDVLVVEVDARSILLPPMRRFCAQL